MIKFLLEGNEFSMVRLLSFLSVLFALIVSSFVICFIFIGTDINYIKEAIFLTGTLLGFGFGGKVVQKFGESKENKNDTEK